MDSSELRPPAKGHPERVVVVDPSKYTELLVSRRNLERVGERFERLHDRETHETFVIEGRAELALARHA